MDMEPASAGAVCVTGMTSTGEEPVKSVRWVGGQRSKGAIGGEGGGCVVDCLVQFGSYQEIAYERARERGGRYIHQVVVSVSLFILFIGWMNGAYMG